MFVLGDLFEVELPAASFDAIVALYSFVHVPAARLGELVERIRGWLRPGGWVCATFGSSDNPGEVEPMWLGAADMYFSSLPTGRMEQLFLDAGFAIRSAETITELEPRDEPATFFWVLAQRTGEETS
jgi:SAM-dependent methyltransferase